MIVFVFLFSPPEDGHTSGLNM